MNDIIENLGCLPGIYNLLQPCNGMEHFIEKIKINKVTCINFLLFQRES